MSADEHDDDIEIAEGMSIVNPDGEKLGRIAALLVDDDEEELLFLLIEPVSGGGPRLLPIEAVEDAEDGALVVDLPPASVQDLPEIAEERDPTEAEIDLAYAVAGLGD